MIVINNARIIPLVFTELLINVNFSCYGNSINQSTIIIPLITKTIDNVSTSV
jgi:hypothetical protein